MEVVLISLIVYVAVQAVVIPVKLIQRKNVIPSVVVTALVLVAIFFIYTFVIAGYGTILTR